MPEMPEVEAVCRKLRSQALGSRIAAVRRMRCASAAVEELAPGRTLDAVDRRAKHILLRLSGGVTVHVHLRMTGNLYWIADHRLHSDRVRTVFELTGGAGIVFEDPRALGMVDAGMTAEVDASLPALGPEPLSEAFTRESFSAAIKGCGQAAKMFLLDQARVSGLGNIYAAEAMFRARVDPRKAIGRLRAVKRVALFEAIQDVMAEGLAAAEKAYGGPGTIGEAEDFPLAVYGREGQPCLVCTRPVRRIVQGSRSTYFCPACQR